MKESKRMEPCNHDLKFQKPGVHIDLSSFKSFFQAFVTATGCLFTHSSALLSALWHLRTGDNEEYEAPGNRDLSLLSPGTAHQGRQRTEAKGQQQDHLLQQGLKGGCMSLLRVHHVTETFLVRRKETWQFELKEGKASGK